MVLSLDNFLNLTHLRAFGFKVWNFYYITLFSPSIKSNNITEWTQQGACHDVTVEENNKHQMSSNVDKENHIMFTCCQSPH